ncbi:MULTISPECIES: helix-turn-helix transcriptional regulator [Streptosporangium]|uniref:Transcriptional regulator with XRE-family HTH domain n=1 Tax=Streptosporangium brasiliense TaxID=47480 RepID=A0ABT9RKU1_9ACTN|nr:helix-turn-helix transcriptional regulator [Streptosporangium brasiliense]MDP9868895.1 transcriptional regulator with XRE-family HTH domain [Streptosporangium brasiliense]
MNQLPEFLRDRRAKVKPGEVGLPEGQRRRTPGLRRQEVAHLAGMSVDYYIRLEQGRGPRPSKQVLNALARALMLTQDERTHLFRLAGQPLEPARRRADVPPGMLHLIAFLEDVPAYVMDAAYNLVAWNPLASALMGSLETRAPHDLNVIRWCFTASDLADHLNDEEKGAFARASVADLRVAAGRYPDDPDIQALVAEMLGCSVEFALLWAQHEVRVRREQRKRISHPTVGVIDVICQVMFVPDRDDLRLVLYTAEPGSASHHALRTLRQLTLT